MILFVNKVANFSWCNKFVDYDTRYSTFHNFDGLFFGKPLYAV